MSKNNNSLYQLWDEFLEQWPVEKVRSMSIEEYTHAGSKDTFTYWLEGRLDKMGSIWGGSAFKFGIFSRNDSSTKESTGKLSYDDNYGWLHKYGDTREVAFQTIRAEIVKIIEAVQSRNIGLIEEVELGPAYKWKIAFHYQDRNKPQVVPIFKKEALQAITQHPNNKPIAHIHEELIAKMQSNQDLLEYGVSLWSQFSGLATIWKISHGKDNFSAEERANFLSRQCVTVHKDTKKSQGDAFSKEMNPGDYFYLCHGNDEGIVLLGRITSEATVGEAEDGWLERFYEVIQNLDEPRRYQGINKGWAPNNNSTVKKVKSNELKLFEEHILRKFFGLSLSDLKTSLAGHSVEGQEGHKTLTITADELALNTIYYGPPGTGKTYKLLTELANELFVDSASTKTEQESDNKRYIFTTFHQSFSYEDFVEGIKPVMDEGVESGLSYQIEDGIFKRIAARAKANPESKYAIFIDEINRGNVASIFGELITLIEPDKRLGNDKTEVIVTLPYSKEKFGVPPNLHIIGTMNTADRSIVALDSALRRRFQFEECFPEPELIEQPDDLSVDLQELLKVINSRISMLLDRDHCIGHSYFMGIVKAQRSLQALRDVFSRSIIPLLEEYFCGDLGRVGMILGERFVQPSSEQDKSITLASGSWDMGLETKDVFQLVDVADLSEDDFASIYERA